MYRLVSALAVFALALIPRGAAADCAFSGLAAKVITPANTIVPGDGGIVVAAVVDHKGSLAPGDEAVHPGWRLRVGPDLLKPPIEVIAPGLAIYRVAVANAFKVELETDKHEVVGTVRPARGSGDPLAAPQVKRAWFEPNKSRHGAERVGVELDGAVPAGAIALVVADAKGTPRSWTLVDGQALYPYVSASC
ncbi:MAG TPA: hypothetical protein VGO00_04955, partial [Kofleriaceae bacterium]|nr:hypothetical protein [Kofleriaceae bacterium]